MTDTPTAESIETVTENVTELPKDRPPRKQSRRRTPPGSSGTAKTRPSTSYTPGMIQEGLGLFYGQLGLMVGMFDAHCGGIIVTNAPQMAASMERLAEESPAVRDLLTKLVTTSVIGEVIAAHIPVVWAITSHHVPSLRARMDAAAMTAQAEQPANGVN